MIYKIVDKEGNLKESINLDYAISFDISIEEKIEEGRKSILIFSVYANFSNIIRKCLESFNYRNTAEEFIKMIIRGIQENRQQEFDLENFKRSSECFSQEIIFTEVEWKIQKTNRAYYPV